MMMFYLLNPVTIAALVMLLVFTVPCVRMLRRAVIGRKRFKGRCYECKFDLRGRAAGGVCPECGSAIIAVGARPPISGRERLWLIAQATALLLPWVLIGAVAWKLAVFSGLGARMFPARFLESKQGRMAEEAAGAILRRYAAGVSSEAAMRKAVDAVARQTSDPERAKWLARNQAEQRTQNEIRSGYHGAGPDDLAAALDEPGMSAKRFDALLRAVIAAYDERPVNEGTDVDAVIAALLAGDLSVTREQGSNSEHPTHQPRELTSEQRASLTGLVLKVQGDQARPWNSLWGSGLELAFSKGLASEAQIRRYLEQSFNPSIIVYDGEKLPRGDVVDFEIKGGWRDAAGSPVRLSAKATGSFADRVTGQVTRGQTRSTYDSSLRFDGMLLLPDELGKRTLTMEVSATYSPELVEKEEKSEGSKLPGEAERLAVRKAFPAVTVTKTVSVDLDLVENDAPKVVEEEAGITVARLWPPGSWSATVLYRPVSGGIDIGVYNRFDRPPIDLAFSGFVRQDGMEHRIGWGFVPRYAGRMGLSLRGVVEGIDPKRPVDVILRSDVGLLERPVWSPRVWKGQQVFKDVRLAEDDEGRMDDW